jgi:hypothetical protein
VNSRKPAAVHSVSPSWLSDEEEGEEKELEEANSEAIIAF